MADNEHLHALVTKCFAELDTILQDTITRLAELRRRVPSDIENPVLFEMGPKGITVHRGHLANAECTANCETAIDPGPYASTGENMGGIVGYWTEPHGKSSE